MEYASLVRSGQLSKDEALKKVSTPPTMEQETMGVVLERLGITEEELEWYMESSVKTFKDYETYLPVFRGFWLRPFWWLMYKMRRFPKGFYIKYVQGGVM